MRDKRKSSNVAMSVNGPNRSEINDFVGRSQCLRRPDGCIEITVLESPRWGRPNEPQVLKILGQAMSRESGVATTTRPAPTREEDDRAIDGYVDMPDGRELIVQVVTVPVDGVYGASVARGDSHIVLTPDQASEWIQGAIDHKLRRYARADRSAMVLALDIRHAPLLADADIVDLVKQRLPDLGFAAIWLVANIGPRSARFA
jgi:hypothetical protein